MSSRNLMNVLIISNTKKSHSWCYCLQQEINSTFSWWNWVLCCFKPVRSLNAAVSQSDCDFILQLQLMIIFIIESKVSSLNLFFWWTNSLKAKYSQFKIICDEEKHSIITSEKIKAAIFGGYLIICLSELTFWVIH